MDVNYWLDFDEVMLLPETWKFSDTFSLNLFFGAPIENVFSFLEEYLIFQNYTHVPEHC